MDFSRKVVILLICFSCTALLAAYSPFLEEGDGNHSNFDTRNLTVSGWQEKNLVSSRAVLDTLQATTTIFSDYFRKNANSVNLYIGYYDSMGKAKLSHAPQVCFTAQGWIMEKNDKVTIQLNGAFHKVNRLLLEKDKERLLVYYWYQTQTGIYADLFRMKLALLGKRILGGKGFDGGNAFVRISTSFTQNEESAPELLQKFSEKLEKELPKVFNNGKAVKLEGYDALLFDLPALWHPGAYLHPSLCSPFSG